MPNAREAVYAAMKALGGTRSVAEVRDWIEKNFEERWRHIGTTMADLVLDGNNSTQIPNHQRFLETAGHDAYRIRADWNDAADNTESAGEALNTIRISALSDRTAVLKAIEEYDYIGRAAFHERYGFGPAKWWYLVHNGKLYDAKAIVGVATGIQFGRTEDLNNFKGGANVDRILTTLGFQAFKNPDADDVVRLPEEVSLGYHENNRTQVWVNKVERSPEARLECLELHGVRCAVCAMDFGTTYGAEFAGLIHVHHLKPLGEQAGVVHTHPQTDLMPVCPNCHAAIHFRNKLRTPEQIRDALTAAHRAREAVS